MVVLDVMGVVVVGVDRNLSSSWFNVMIMYYVFLFYYMWWVVVGAWNLTIWITSRLTK